MACTAETTLPEVFVVGINEARVMRYGWYDRERFIADIVGRCSMEQAELCLHRNPEHTRLMLQMAALPENVGAPISGGLFHCDACLGEFVLQCNGWMLFEFDVSSLPMGEIMLRLEVGRCWIPAEAVGTADYRRLGVFVAAGRLK